MPPDDSAFAGIPRKIGRAKEHIAALDALLSAFHQSDTYRLVREDNPQTGNIDIRVHFAREVPEAVPLLIGDAIHNLRSALDHFAYAAVGNPTSETAFPVWRRDRAPTAHEMRSLVNQRLAGAQAAVIHAVRALQPYKGGNDEWLWTINYLDIVDKHRLLVTTRQAYSVGFDFAGRINRLAAEAGMDIGPFPPMEFFLVANDGAIDGGIVFSGPPQYFEDQPNVNFRFFVALDEPETVHAQRLAPLLSGYADEVEGLLDRLIHLA